MNPGMDEMENKENEFSDNIERLLAGEDIKTDASTDEEYRVNIAFSKKIMEVRGEPSQEFRESLKNRLLTRLAEQESKKTNAHFWDRLKNPALRMATVSVAVVVFALLVVWRMGYFSPAEQPPISTGLGPTVAVESRASTSKTTFASGEQIDIHFTFKNITGETLSFPFPPEVSIENLNTGPVRVFTAGKDLTILAAGESMSYDLTWDQKDDNGNQVPAGEYQIVMPNVQLGDEKGVVSLTESPVLTIR